MASLRDGVKKGAGNFIATLWGHVGLWVIRVDMIAWVRLALDSCRTLARCKVGVLRPPACKCALSDSEGVLERLGTRSCLRPAGASGQDRLENLFQRLWRYPEDFKSRHGRGRDRINPH
jgi:hypothetical protein